MVLGTQKIARSRTDEAETSLRVDQETDRQHRMLMEEFDELDSGRSNFVAFLLGGVVIAGGMLAFLYYDSSPMSTRDITTGSIAPLEQSTPAPTTGLPGLPLQVKPAR